MFTRIAISALFLCTVMARAANPPSIANVAPPAGIVSTLTAVTVTFSVPVAGVDADDLLVNTQPASSVSGGGAVYTFSFAQPLYGNVSFSWFPSHGIADQADPQNGFDGTAPSSQWQYTLVDTVPPTVVNLFPAAGATVRALTQVEVTFGEEVTGVNVADLLVNSQPATSVTRVAGGPYVFGFAAPAAGVVQFQWAGGHGITDQATSPNGFAGGSWSVTLDPNLAVNDLVITEIHAANITGLTNEFGQAEDWIEIQNRGTAPVNLGGWSLSETEALPGQWVFPSATLQPRQFLVVFASGLDRRVVGGTNRLHTNFKLSRSGEFLGLFSPDSPRVLVSGFSPGYPEQRNDNSYGYDPEGNLRYFATPTPGASNGVSTITGVVEPVHFSVSRGFYTQPFDLILTCPTPGATIRYTTNGSVPTLLNGNIYATRLPITRTTHLRAAAFRNNLLPSPVTTHSYLFNFTATQRSVPVINLVTDTNNLIGRTGIIGMGGGSRAGDGLYITNNPATDYHNPSAHGIAWERPVSVEYLVPRDNSGFQIDAGLRVQGSDWQRPRTTPTSKFSFRLYFRGDYGAGELEYPFFPLTSVDSFDQLVLRAGFNEQVNPFIRDEVTRRLSHDMGQVAAIGSMALVLLNSGPYTNNSSLVPVYNPTERVTKEFMQSHLGGGPDWDVVAPSFAVSASGLGVIDGDRNDFNNLMTNFWSGSLRPITNQVAYERVSKRLDLVNFVDYCMLNAYVAMGDWPANNWRAARERSTNGIWRYIAWDCEWAMGIYALAITRDSFAFSGTGTEDAGLNSTGNSEIARTYQALRPHPEFRLLWADRIRKHFFNGGALTPANISNRFEQLRVELLGYIPSMETEIPIWARDRHAIILGQFNTYGLYGYSNALYGVFASSNAPSFSQHGGRVAPGFSLTMTAPIPGSVIYYTTNGADPRVMFTGAISNAAVQYTGAVTLNQGMQVRARALLNGTNWSALNEATFEIGRVGTPVRITEIHYNPADGPAYEFIELQNLGGAAVQLSSAYFDGINYTFNVGATLPPGAKILLATDTDPAAFAARYPGVTVFDYFGGSLNNGGERLTLFDKNGDIITSVDYDNANPWPTAADGAGPSLEIIDPTGDPDDPANWRPSSLAGGSPGTTPGAPAPGPVRLNEILAINLTAAPNPPTFPDYIELHNTGAVPINLAGWSLTDDSNPRKYVLPATSIAAGGYLLLWCDDTTNMTPGLHTGFTLSANGDSVALYDAATNRVDALSFGLQLADRSVGRAGAGWTLNTPTPNAPNVPAPLGTTSTLSINEWLANASPGFPDWIELYNPSAQPVALRDIYLATTSAVHQVTSLSFIAPGGFAQLFADEAVGPDHLDFKLPAAGGSIILYDATATEVNRVTYTAAVEGLTRGRLPDGTATLVNFPGSASPGASNYTNTYSGPVLNEVLARNQSAVTNAGRVADYIELFNGGVSAFDLGGMSVSVNAAQPGEWIFPPSTSLAAGGYLVIWCDGSRPVATNGLNLNTGESLDGESGGVYLFNPAGQLVNSVEYGFQVADRSIGLSAGQWNLLSAPTPGGVNSPNAQLGNATTLRINEWMADPVSGPDWFELYNTNAVPVSMNGLTLTDDPSTVGLGQYRVAPLSYIGPNGFVQWIADGDADQGRNHVNFSLDGGGETIRLYATNGANFILLDSITFAGQLLGVSEGRLLDGESSIYSFPGSATPAAPNAVLEPNIVINEILTHTDLPLEDAVELFNAGTAPVNLGGWFLSNSRDNLKKYRIPDNTVIAAGGFAVFSQSEFGLPGQSASFTFNSAHGDEVWLSGADPATGRLTGYRAGAAFGAAANGVSFGRIQTSAGVDYAALSQRTLGTANANPLVGPVVINEIMYNPISGAEEYIELRNITAAPVALFDIANTANRWQLRDGVEFTFPSTTTLAAGAYALVVDFDPNQNATALATFRARYNVSLSVPIMGPFTGSLANGGDDIELVRPDTPQPPGAPDAGFVPYLLVDRLNYADATPWPAGLVDGGGLSLQRENSSAYGNEALNWVAANPTAGAANSAGIVAPPIITTPPQSQTVLEGLPSMLEVAATGTGPLTYQWRLNGLAVPGATNDIYLLEYTIDTDEGAYDVLVSNAGGASLAGPAALKVNVPPIVLTPPMSQIVGLGTNVSFNVVARGEAPLSYQWRLNGLMIPGATNFVLSRTNVTLADNGVYDVVISNSVSVTLISATLTILSNTIIVVPPLPLTNFVVAGATLTVSVQAFGNPLPFDYEWRRGSATVQSNVVNSYVDYFTFTAPTNITTQLYRVLVRNLANRGTTANAQFYVATQADNDADGLPDTWEAGFGMNTNSAADRNLDSDGDRMSNYSEYVAGTDPTNAASYLRVDLSVIPGQATVLFNAASNKNYSVRYTDRLNSGQWLKLGDVLAHNTNRVAALIDPSWTTNRFYQLVTPGSH